MNWQDMYEKKTSPPFKPKLRNQKDTDYFDKNFTNAKPEESVEISGIDPSPNHYSGFTYAESDSICSSKD